MAINQTAFLTDAENVNLIIFASGQGVNFDNAIQVAQVLRGKRTAVITASLNNADNIAALAWQADFALDASAVLAGQTANYGVLSQQIIDAILLPKP